MINRATSQLTSVSPETLRPFIEEDRKEGRGSRVTAAIPEASVTRFEGIDFGSSEWGHLLLARLPDREGSEAPGRFAVYERTPPLMKCSTVISTAIP